ncbi:MAG TPA: response regulator [Aggregatilineales bacterium]|nr:response regulator [Aggregatilineales bacterium]
MPHSVLVVEDDVELRAIYRRVFEKVGYDIIEAANGAEALSILDEFMPDAIVLDMLMPTMGGDTVLKRLRSMQRDATKVIIITAYSSYRHAAEAEHVDAFLVKPVPPEEILHTVASLLNE